MYYVAMLKASLLESASKNVVPSPQMNGHRTVCSTDPQAPPVPPRTYSQRPHLSNGSVSPSMHGQHKPLVHSKSFKHFNLTDFKFVKLLGKGSFGKVKCFFFFGMIAITVEILYSNPLK